MLRGYNYKMLHVNENVILNRISKNVNHEGTKSHPRKIGEGDVEERYGEGFPSPGNGSSAVKLPENVLTTDMLYTNFNTYFVVKFFSLLLAFQIFL